MLCEPFAANRRKTMRIQATTVTLSLALALPALAQAQMPPERRPDGVREAPAGEFHPGMPGRVSVVAPVTMREGPPPPRHEMRTPPPSDQHIWIEGHWAARNNRQEWLGGHWALPPGPGYGWEPARWDRDGDHYAFREGHWRTMAVPAPTVIYQPAPPPPQPVYVQAPPPAPIVEVRPDVPFPGAVWIPGYWTWHGAQHFWVAGQWSAPHGNHAWEAERWNHEKRGWRMAPGRWR